MTDENESETDENEDEFEREVENDADYNEGFYGIDDAKFTDEDKEKIMSGVPVSDYADDKSVKMSDVSFDEKGDMILTDVTEKEQIESEKIEVEKESVVIPDKISDDAEKISDEIQEKPESTTTLYDSRTQETVKIPDEEKTEIEQNITISKLKEFNKSDILKELYEKIPETNPFKEIFRESDEEILTDADKVIQEAKREKSKQVLSRVVSDDSIYKLNPAIDFYKNIVFMTFPINIEMDKTKEVHLIPHLVTSKRTICEIKKNYIDELNIRMRTVPFFLEEKVSPEFIRKFLNNELEKTTLNEVYENIKNELKKYLHFDDEKEYDFITLWIIGTYFHRLFKSYPYLYIGGSKRTGKSKLLDFLYCVCFNAQEVVSPTLATIYRMIDDSSCTLLFDEEYKVANKEESDFRSILLKGYKKGGLVPRMRESDKKNYSISLFEAYCPKAFANIEGLDDVMADRSVSIIMSRYNNAKVVNKSINPDDLKWQKIREDLYQIVLENQLFSVVNVEMYMFFGSSVIEVGDRFGSSLNPSLLKNIYNTYITYNNYTKTSKIGRKGKEFNIKELYDAKNENDDETKNDDETLKNADVNEKKQSLISARYFEIYNPILTISLALDIEKLNIKNSENEQELNKLVDYFKKEQGIFFEMLFYIENKIKEYEIEQQESKDANHFSMLYKFMLEHDDGYYHVSEVTKAMKFLEQKNYSEKDLDYLTAPRSFGRFLKRHKIQKMKVRDGRGIKIYFEKARLIRIAKQYGIDLKGQFKDYEKMKELFEKDVSDDRLAEKQQHKAKQVKGQPPFYKYHKGYKDEEHNQEETLDDEKE